MSKQKTRFMVAAGASVVVVRDGKRKTILPNMGEEFTEEEIASINKAVPGTLRKAVNEGAKAKTRPVENAEDDDDAETEDAETEDAETEDDADDDAEQPAPAPAKKSAAKKGGKKSAAKKSDEDEDI